MPIGNFYESGANKIVSKSELNCLKVKYEQTKQTV